MGEVVSFPGDGSVGDGVVVDPDLVLEAAKGDFAHVVVVGYGPDGRFDLRSSHGSREVLWALAQAQRLILETEFEGRG